MRSANLIFLSVLSLFGCAHARAPVAVTPVPAEKPLPVIAPTVAAATPAPATVEAVDAVPAACQLSATEQAHLHQFGKIRHYLKQQAFPQWETSWPHLFLYGERCQIVLNYGDSPGEGFRLSNQKFELAGFTSNLVFYRENAVTMPSGSKLPYFIPAQAFTSGERSGEKWFVIGLYDVWRRDYNDALQSFFGMFSREMFRSFQERIPGLRVRGDAAARETFSRFCRQNAGFARMVDVERSLLMRAVNETNGDRKRELTKQYLDNESRRRTKFFVAEHANWRHDEPWLESLDGSAEYMNFRILTDCPEIPKEARLVNAEGAGKAFATCSRVPLNDALRQVAFRPSYVQDLGVLQMVLLNQVVPRWQDSLFRSDTSVQTMLTNYASDLRVTR